MAVLCPTRKQGLCNSIWGTGFTSKAVESMLKQVESMKAILWLRGVWLHHPVQFLLNFLFTC